MEISAGTISPFVWELAAEEERKDRGSPRFVSIDGGLQLAIHELSDKSS